MRKVTFGAANSLDNRIARENGAVDWLLSAAYDLDLQGRCYFTEAWAPIGALADAAARAGQRDSARHWLDEPARDPVARRAQALLAAFTATALGDQDQALGWLRQAAEEPHARCGVRVDRSLLAPLRSDPAFARWADAAGVPRPRAAGGL